MTKPSQPDSPGKVLIFGRIGTPLGYMIRDFLHRCDIPFRSQTVCVPQSRRDRRKVAGAHCSIVSTRASCRSAPAPRRGTRAWKDRASRPANGNEHITHAWRARPRRKRCCTFPEAQGGSMDRQPPPRIGRALRRVSALTSNIRCICFVEDAWHRTCKFKSEGWRSAKK